MPVQPPGHSAEPSHTWAITGSGLVMVNKATLIADAAVFQSASQSTKATSQRKDVSTSKKNCILKALGGVQEVRLCIWPGPPPLMIKTVFARGGLPSPSGEDSMARIRFFQRLFELTRIRPKNAWRGFGLTWISVNRRVSAAHVCSIFVELSHGLSCHFHIGHILC